MQIKKRIEIIFKTDGNQDQLKAIDKTILMIGKVLIIANNEAKKEGWNFNCKLKEKK